jgi:hypothetical protein
MLRAWQYASTGSRDLRIDWLRGLAMVCVIVDHSKLSSLLSWFSYERFWTVTAAEVFVVLSGAVLGMVYGNKLRRGDWRGIVRGLSRRVITLYVAFLAVTASVAVLSLAGIDVTSLTTWTNANGGTEFLTPERLDAAAWRDIALMRSGPWAFEIVGLYVWLVVAAIPCLLALRHIGWRPLIALSWGLYLWYRLAPHRLTAGHFESTFPILAWQLLFVHGIAIGCERDRVHAFLLRYPRSILIAAVTASSLFIVFALCNPWTDGPRMLPWTVVSNERFADLYSRYFTLSDLGIGRLLNLAAALPVGYALLTRGWRLASAAGGVLIILGQQSLGAFVLHIYALLMIAHLPAPFLDDLWINTLLQIGVILAITGILAGIKCGAARRMTTIGLGRPLVTAA